MADYHSDIRVSGDEDDVQITGSIIKRPPASEIIDLTEDSHDDSDVGNNLAERDTATPILHIKSEFDEIQQEQGHPMQFKIEHNDQSVDLHEIDHQNDLIKQENEDSDHNSINSKSLAGLLQGIQESLEASQTNKLTRNSASKDENIQTNEWHAESEKEVDVQKCAASTHTEEGPLFVPEGSKKRGLEGTDDTCPVSESAEDSDGKPSTKKPRTRGRKATDSSRKPKKERAKPKKTKRTKRATESPGTFDIEGLLNQDIIAQANANQGMASQPGFTTEKKKDALAQLIASIPEDERLLYRGDKVDLDKATRKFNGHGAIKADGSGNWKLKGMKTSLRHYQLLGVSWMRERENETGHPKGGILGDGMGLGKTISALANIVDGRLATSTSNKPRATLIVMPPSLMSQWLSEVDNHVESDVLKAVMIYRSRLKMRNIVSALGNMDIVITSYNEVLMSLPKNDPPPHIYTPQGKAEWWEKEVQEKKGPLHQVEWHRVILDEAQAIKNRLSRTSEAICRLKGRYRWCLSGTPVQNGLDEFYPYFKFLRCKDTGDFELFKRNFTKNGSQKALERLQIWLNKIMLRRTHADKMFGRPIVQLPPIKPVETIEVMFNSVERTIYHIIEQRFVKRLQNLVKKDGSPSGRPQILVMLLRLRQLVGHPLLIQKTLKELLEIEDIERLWKLSKTGNHIDLVDEEVDPNGSHETALALNVAINKSFTSPGRPSLEQVPDNELSSQFRKYLQALHKDGTWAAIKARSFCSACGAPPERPFITSCLHLYCFDCLDQLTFSGRAQNQKDEVACQACGQTINASSAYAAQDFDEAGIGTVRKLTPQEDIDWYDIPGPMLRSAKIKGVVAQVKKWFEQDHTNKIIIFTQFRGLVKILGRICDEEPDWGYATFTGEMTQDSRDEQVVEFTTNPTCRILLCSLKAGGVGLNLTAANRVIILDLWWNNSVEAQAFSRCFRYVGRIGQTRDVEVVRFVVRNSVDTRIQQLQERKQAEIGKAMDQRPTEYTKEDLMKLFGEPPTTTNEETANARSAVNNDTFVFADDPYDRLEEDDS